jgi:hypothetical protein
MPRVRTLDQIPQLSDFERVRILEIVRRIGRSVGTILRCCQAWTPEGREHRARRLGTPDVVYLVAIFVMTKSNPNAGQLAFKW